MFSVEREASRRTEENGPLNAALVVPYAIEPFTCAGLEYSLLRRFQRVEAAHDQRVEKACREIDQRRDCPRGEQVVPQRLFRTERVVCGVAATTMGRIGG